VEKDNEMAFDISQIKLPQIDISGAFSDLHEKLKKNIQKIPTFDPDFDAVDFQPMLLSKIEESKLPDFMKIPAKFGVQLMTESPEDIVTKREIWQEIRRIHPEKAEQIKQIENMPTSFAMIGKDTLEELPEDLQKSAQRYADTQLMDIGFSVGFVERVGEKAALPLLKGIKAKIGGIPKKTKLSRVAELGEGWFVDLVGAAHPVTEHSGDISRTIRVVTKPGELILEFSRNPNKQQLERVKKMFERLKLDVPDTKIFVDVSDSNRSVIGSQVFKSVEGISKFVDDKLRSFYTKSVPKVEDLFQKDFNEFMEEIPNASKRVVSYDTAKGIAENAFENYLKDPDNPVFKDETKRLFQQVGELIKIGEVNPDDLQAIFKKYNLNPEKFADIYMDTITTSAKQLNELSRLKKKMVAAFPEMEEKLAKLPVSDTGPWAKMSKVFRNIEHTRRGLMVSQLATTARNIISQGGRFTMQFADDVLTGAMEMTTGKRPPKESFAPALQDMLSVARQFSPKKRQMLANTVDQFPIEKVKLFGTPMGDFVLGDKVTRTVNTLNTAQEYFFRKMRMDALINTHFQRGGGAITQELMENWVDDALELTFAKRPQGGFLGQFYETFNHPFFTAVGNPFPRFWANSMKFLWDFSPGGFTKLLSPKFLKELTSSDPRKAYSALSKATLGTMMFAGGMAVRNSEELAGEKWYEVKMPNGKTWDTRAFAPFSTYLFLAEAMKEDNQLTGMDYAQGLISINRIAGTGLVLVDLIRAKNADTLEKNIKNFAGAYLSGFTVPFRTFKDFIAQAVPSEAVYKDTDQAPLLGPALENIPFATSDFPTAPRATRAEPFIREDPIMRQLTGMTLKTKTPLEQEIDRLGIEYTSLYPRTGEDELDRMITRKVGAVMDVIGNEMVNTSEFQKLPDVGKKEILKELYSDTKSLSKKAVMEESAAQIAAGIYQQMKDLQGEELIQFVKRLENKGLLKDNIMEFILGYKKSDINPSEVTNFIQTQMGGEKTPRIFGLPVP